MGFTDALKRSLGFEEDTSLHNKQQNNYRRPSTPSSDFRMSNNNASDLSSHSYYDDVSISPEQSFYEIMLIRPKTIDDINYVVDQVLEESNPVILDLSFLEKESPANFKLAGEKRLFDISSLDEWRTQTYENAELFKEKVKRWHDKRIQKREFKVGEYVY